MVEEYSVPINFVDVRRQLQKQPLIDYGKAGNKDRRIRELPGSNIIVKDILLGTLQGEQLITKKGTYNEIGREIFVGGRFVETPFMAGVEDFYETTDEQGRYVMRLVMKKIEGSNLVVPADPKEISQIGRELSANLAYVAEREQALVDIKPDNIKWNPKRKKWIFIDFGESVRFRSQAPGCTFEYSSPDIDIGIYPEGIDDRHDVYCLASTLAEPLLGKLPNEMYFTNPDDVDPRLIIRADPNARNAVYQQICTDLRNNCGTNYRLAEALAKALHPEKSKRIHAREFAQLMEETSSTFRAFPTIKEETFRDIQGKQYSELQGIGSLLSTLANSALPAMSGQVLPPLEELQRTFFKGTNLARVGLIAKVFTETALNANEQQKFFKGLEEQFRMNQTPFYMLEGEPFRPPKDAEKEAMRLIIRIADTGRAFEFLRDETRAAMFANLCLKVLLGKAHSSDSGYWNASWDPVLYNVALGFERQQEVERIAKLGSVQAQAEYYHSQGVKLTNEGKLSDALATYDRAIGLVGESEAIWSVFDRGKILFRLKRYAEAEAAFHKADTLLVGSIWPKTELGKIQLQMKHLSQAKTYFTQATENHPENWEGHNGLIEIDRLRQASEREHIQGKAFLDDGNYQHALAAYNRAISIAGEEDVPWTLYDRGITLRHLQRYDEAIQSLQKAGTYMPGSTWVFTQLGITLLEKGDTFSAKYYLDQAIKVDPNNTLAAAELAKMS